MIRSAALLGLVLGALALAPPAPAAPPRPAQAAQVWASSADGARKLARQADLAPAGSPAAGTELTIDPARTDQRVVGFGAAMTDASAELLQTALPSARRRALYAELFGRQGLALGFVRVPIGASDFSRRHYSLNDLPPGQRDPAMARFSMAEPARFQIPALRAARRVNPGLVLMASPWSAPAWMKDSRSLITGRLRADAHAAYAAYFARYLDAMARAGLPVSYVSVQNEPAFEPKDYPGMRMSAADRAAFVAHALGPALARRRQRTQILEWDHNWDHPEEPLAVLADPAARRFIAGVAWHCYAGDPKVMAEVRAAYPDTQVFFSECSGGNWSPNWGEAMGWMFDNLIIAPLRAGSRGTLLWNLALDETHGPHLGGCGDCRAVVTIDRASGTVTRNLEYYVLGHASRFVRPGAQRIASHGGETAGAAHAAFRNPDGSLVLLARNGGNMPLALAITMQGKAWRLTMPAGEIITLVWPASGPRR